MAAKKRTTKKAARKHAAKKAAVKKVAKAFDLAFRTPEEATVPKPVDPPVDLESWDADEFSEYAPKNKNVKVHVAPGVTASIEEADASVTIQPETPTGGEATPSGDVVPEKPQKPAQRVTAPQETAPYTNEEAALIVEALIDATNHLFSLAKKKVKPKDEPILRKRVKRGRLLVAQLQNA